MKDLEYDLTDNILYTTLVYKERIQDLCEESGLSYKEEFFDTSESGDEIQSSVNIASEIEVSKILSSEGIVKDLFGFYCEVYRKLVDLLENSKEL